MELIDTNQAAELLCVAPATVRVLAHQGRLTRQGSATRPSRYGRPRALYALEEVVSLQATRRAA